MVENSFFNFTRSSR